LKGMREHCHTCGGELSRDGGVPPFCPHCGAPQIYLSEHDQAETGADETTGAMPPPKPQVVEWKTAIRCAALVALVAAVLGGLATRVPLLSPLSSLWTLSGSLIAVGLYQRRRPAAWMDAGVGARIGIVVGLALVACLATSMAVAGLVARYGLHSMAGFDAELTAQIHAQIEKAAAANPEPAEVMRYLYSPEFRAGMLLTGFAMLSGVLLVLSALGGAVGGMLRTRRRASV
jgi:hypothetical protein